MGTKLLTERLDFSGTVGTGDRSNVIEGVLLCGATSANRRRYKREAFAGDRVKRYNGKQVYVNHGDSRKPRDYQDLIGDIENARLNADGLPIGDIVVNPEKERGRAVLWDARNRPNICGMSHVAQCSTVTSPDGWEDVLEVVEVESVDVVVDPATTKGWRESKGQHMSFTITQLAEWVAKHPKSTTAQSLKAKKLAEMDGMGDMPMADAPAEDADPNDAITAGFKAAFDAIRDQLFSGKIDWKEAQKKLKSLHAGHGDATGTAAPKGGDSDEGESDDEPAEESKRPTLANVLKECTAAGYTPLNSDLLALAEMTNPESRAAFIDAKKTETKPAGTQPTQASRRPGAGIAGVVPAAATTKTTEQKVENARLIPSWD